MSKLITPAYAAEQVRLHRVDPMFGAEGFNWAYLIAGIAVIKGCKSVLDYVCGKGSLKKFLAPANIAIGDYDLLVSEYDPGVPGKDGRPEPADLVATLDVLEHVEPDCIDAVFADLTRVSRKLLFVVVSTKLSKRIMADGRDTHISLHDDPWWRAAFKAHGFTIRREWNTGLRLWVALLEPPVRSC